MKESMLQLPSLEGVSGWERARMAVRAIAAATKDDLRPNKPPTSDVIRAAFAFLDNIRGRDNPPPDAVYMLPDGHIVFDWRRVDATTVSYEIIEMPFAGVGQADGMLSFDDDREAEFWTYRFPVEANPFEKAFELYQRHDRWCDFTEYSLAS